MKKILLDWFDDVEDDIDIDEEILLENLDIGGEIFDKLKDLLKKDPKKDVIDKDDK